MLRICPRGATKLVRQRMCVLRRKGGRVCDSRAALGFTCEEEKREKNASGEGEVKEEGEWTEGGEKENSLWFVFVKGRRAQEVGGDEGEIEML